MNCSMQHVHRQHNSLRLRGKGLLRKLTGAFQLAQQCELTCTLWQEASHHSRREGPVGLALKARRGAVTVVCMLWRTVNAQESLGLYGCLCRQDSVVMHSIALRRLPPLSTEHPQIRGQRLPAPLHCQACSGTSAGLCCAWASAHAFHAAGSVQEFWLVSI